MSTEEVQETTETAKDEAVAPLKADTNSSINAPLDEVEDPSVLKDMVKKLRAENAKTRTEKNASKSELEEFKAWKESQMTEAEKLQARLVAAEEKVAAAERRAIISEFNLPEDLAEFVTGTEDEMRAKAEKLAARVASEATHTAPSVPDAFKVPGGEPLKPKKKNSGAAFLEDLFNNS